MADVQLGVRWVREPEGRDTVVLFVHGILSDGQAAWKHRNGANWPEMLAEEAQFGDVSIGVFSYRADASARTFSQSDAADHLREEIGLYDGWRKRCLIFVCHSLGGIVVRRMLVANQQELLRHNLTLGLFLVASPTLGSDDANRFHFLARMLESTQADALRFSQENVWLNDLRQDFVNLKETGSVIIRGKELVEDEPLSILTAGGLVRRVFGQKHQVVEPYSAAGLFPNPVKIPRSDHNRIAKPESRQALQHRILVRFVLDTKHYYPSQTHQEPIGDESDRAASALRGLRGRLQAGKIADFEALAAIQEALLETRAYLAGRAKGGARDGDVENLLSQVWGGAGVAIARHDPELGMLCSVKGHGWADEELWERPGFKELPTSVDEMLEAVLGSTRKASESARKMPGGADLTVVEGTLILDTITWRTTVLLPPFVSAPAVTLARRNGGADGEPKIEDVTADKFTASINRTTLAGEWVWRARGVLLTPRALN